MIGNKFFLTVFSISMLLCNLYGQNREVDSENAKTLIHGTFEYIDTTWKIFGAPGVPPTDYEGTLTSFGNGYVGSGAAQINVYNAQEENWHIQLKLPTWYCEKNKLYRFSMYAKGSAPIDLSISKFPSYDYKEGCTFDIYDSYNRYSYLFSSDTTADSALLVTLNVGSDTGSYFFDEIKIEEVLTMDPEDDWYSRANERIEEIRKGNFSVKIQNKKGPVTHRKVKAELVKHDFPFGTAANFDTTAGVDESWYKQKITRHFNSMVTENALKWVDFEPKPDSLDTANFRAYTEFAKENNLMLRGHVLAWGLQKHGFENHWPIQDDGQFLIDNLRKRIKRDVALYKGLIDEYDVWNEPIHEKSMFDKTYENFLSIGYWSLLDSAFHWARSVDSTAGLFVNEYNVALGGRTETLYDLVSQMLERNVPITGIGVQCHLEDDKVDPELFRRRLDILDKLDLTIRVTEFDMGIPGKGLNATEQHQAKEYGKFLRTAFSHPAVDGILLWGFTDDKHWVGPVGSNIGSGLYRVDRSMKPAADTIIKLWESEWTTYLEKELDESNQLDFRGFYGTYRISYEEDGRVEYFDTISLTRDTLSGEVFLSETGGINIAVPSKEIQKRELNLRYIPSDGVLSIQTGNVSKAGNIKVVNIQGKTVIQKEFFGKESYTLKLKNIAKGLYFITLTSGSEKVLRKIIL